MDRINSTRWQRMTEEERREHVEELVHDPDVVAEESDGDFSSGSDNDWIPARTTRGANLLENIDDDDSDGDVLGDIELDEEADSSDDEEEAMNELGSISPASSATEELMKARDGTVWTSQQPAMHKTLLHNILRERRGPHISTRMLSVKDTWKKLFSNEMLNIIVRETNRKGEQLISKENAEKTLNNKDFKKKVWKRVALPELETFLGLLIIGGVYQTGKISAREMWGKSSYPLFRAAMDITRFLCLSRCIRFDNSITRNDRKLTDKAAAIRDIWNMLNANLSANYKPSACITVDEQLFPFRGGTPFTQYIPSKPAKYGIKVWWVCDSESFYPLQGSIYTGKLPNQPRDVNQGENVVKLLVHKYKGTGRNVTMDNFFTSLPLARLLLTWKLSTVGTLRKNKKYIPAEMLPNANRVVESTIFGFNDSVSICSYVPKKKKSVILMSTLHNTTEVSGYQKKPEAIHYYNKTKAGVDVMDKMLGEYSRKRATRRWPYAFFFNMVDVSALAAYVIYSENNNFNNANDKKHSARRSFLLDLGNQLVMPAILERSANPKIQNNFTKRSAIENVLGSPISAAAITGSGTGTISHPKEQDGRRKFTGCCYVCNSAPKKRRRKTRKSCCECHRPICDEHTNTISRCYTCVPTPTPSTSREGL